MTKRLPTSNRVHTGEDVAQLRTLSCVLASQKYSICKGLGLPLPLPPSLDKLHLGTQPSRSCKDTLQHWLRKQKQVSEKVLCSQKRHLSWGSCGWGWGSFGFNHSTSPLGGARLGLAFAEAQLLYRTSQRCSGRLHLHHRGLRSLYLRSSLLKNLCLLARLDDNALVELFSSLERRERNSA